MSIQSWNSVQSAELEMATSLALVTPGEHLPRQGPDPRLLILLHGLTGNHTQWLVRADLQELADRHNLVIALPDGQRSFWLNQVHGLRWGAWVGAELPALLARRLRLSPDRPLIGGLSMGGYGALRAAFDYPRTFAGAFSLSGTLDVTEPAFRGRHPDLYQIGFGSDEAARPEDDLVARAGGSAELPPVFASCGTGDRLLDQNRRFAEAMGRSGHRMEYREGPGEHNFAFWTHWLPVATEWTLAAASN